jgi:hypothetical protein
LKKACKATKKHAKAAKAALSQPDDQSESGKAKDKQFSSDAKDGSSQKVTFATKDAEPQTVDPNAPAPSEENWKRAKLILKALKGKIQPQDI